MMNSGALPGLPSGLDPKQCGRQKQAMLRRRKTEVAFDIVKGWKTER